MNILLSLVRYLSGLIFRLGLVITPLVIAVMTIAYSPAIIKDTLRDSGIYNAAGQEIISTSQEATTDQNGKDALANPDIQRIALDAFTPSVLQRSTEQIITDTYRWLDGTMPTLRTTLDFAGPRDQLITGLQAYAKQRASTLPACTIEQLRTLDTQKQDILTIPCVPPGLDIESASRQFSDEVTSNADFLSNPQVTVEPFKDKTSDNEASMETRVPHMYQLIPVLLWATTTATVIGAALYILLSKSRRHGQVVVARWLIVAGVLFFIGDFVWRLLSKDSIDKLQSGNTEAFRAAIGSIGKSLIHTYESKLLLIAGCYIVAGALWWVAAVLLFKSKDPIPVGTRLDTKEKL